MTSPGTLPGLKWTDMGYDNLVTRNQLCASHVESGRSIAKTLDAYVQIASEVLKVIAFSLRI